METTRKLSENDARSELMEVVKVVMGERDLIVVILKKRVDVRLAKCSWQHSLYLLHLGAGKFSIS